MTLLKEAWLQEIVAAYNDPTPNDPGTLYRYVSPPHAFSVGYVVEIMPQGKDSWEELKAGVLAEGLLTDRVMAALEALPVRRFSAMMDSKDYPVEPPTWAMYLYGKYPFGAGYWNIFGFTSRDWETLVDEYEDPITTTKEDHKPRIRMEIQFQLRPATKWVQEWVPGQGPKKEVSDEEDDPLFNSLVDALDTVSGIKNHELRGFLEELDEVMDEDEGVYERFEQEAPRIIAILNHADASYLVRVFDYVLTGQGSI